MYIRDNQIQELINYYNMNKKLWSPQDDALIIELVKKFGCGKWTYISKMLRETYSTRRSEKQIRERYVYWNFRWHNHLNPEIIKRAWSA